MSDKGIIYLMTTAVKGLVKIGKTGSSSFESRMYQLESNGYSNVTSLKRALAIEVDDYHSKEKLIHVLLEKSRVGQTELFATDVNMVKQLLSAFEGNLVYPPNKDKDEAFEQAADIKESGENSAMSKPKITRTSVPGKVKDLIYAGLITPGDKLILSQKDQVREATVTASGAVLFDGVEYKSPSRASAVSLGQHSNNGWDSWHFQSLEGKTLSELRAELNLMKSQDGDDG